MPFAPVKSEVRFAAEEERVLTLWETLGAFSRSVNDAKAAKRPDYIFYDGPPFATGLPHYGHLVASTLKDIVPRYWAMRGFTVERRFGWDTHGLPIEMVIEKQLGLSGRAAIRAYGVDKFNEACRDNVLKYVGEWRRTITRLGRWVDFDNDYKTMDASYMESVWWVFAQLWNKGLVYQGVRVMPYSWRLSTPLSNFEAGLDYRDVDDPALTVRMQLDELIDGEAATLLAWTTTPWTLPSNLAVAVGADIDYVRARHEDGNVYIVAAALKDKVLSDKATVLSTFPGSALAGKRYAPLFAFFADRKSDNAFQIVTSTHVTVTDGTGLVHMAPAFGEDDYAVCKAHGIALVDPVDAEGNFTAQVPPYQGQNVKDADKHIIADLKAKGLVFRHATIKHAYPYCWRSGTPLIYKSTPSWYVKVQEMRDRMVAANAGVHWVPGFVGEKRFDNWLKEARDWSISRSRFWGTPIPVWQCDSCPTSLCIGSVADLQKYSGVEATDLHPHKIDHLTWRCTSAACAGLMKRIEEVFDCWFESGSMPYAQMHYPFENKERFEASFPAQFIAEGLDQTRGWFYTLMILSTALFDKPAFKNCIVNGLVLAQDGAKMSKSKQNYPDPHTVLDEYGADALRAYLINSPVVRADSMRFSEAGVKEIVRTVLLPLQNAWSFFVTYANIDGFEPARDLARAPTPSARPEIDRWILSVQQSLVATVNTQMEGYYLDRVVPPMLAFIDDLTNWYIRRCRRRFWRAVGASGIAADADKMSAYATLYEVLTTFSQLLAPVLPFISEALYQNLVVGPGMAKDGHTSVHLTRYPEVDRSRIDADVEASMASVRRVVTVGRALREQHKLKTRQPLRTVTVVSTNASLHAQLHAQRELLMDELNVKHVELTRDDAALCTLAFKANFKTLGKKLGPHMKEAALVIAGFTPQQWAVLQADGSIEVLGAAIVKDDVQVTRTARGDVILRSDGDVTVALDTVVDDELRMEGHARDVVRELQERRKSDGLAVTDRIRVVLSATAFGARSVSVHRALIMAEVLAEQLDVTEDLPDDAAAALTIASLTKK